MESLYESVELYLWVVIAVAVLYNVFKLINPHKGVTGFFGNIMGYFPTIVHEFGHVIGCKLMFGRVDDIVLVHTRKNQQKGGAYGYAVTYNKGRIARTVKAFLGYVFPPLLLGLFIYLNSVNLVVIAFLILILGSLYLLVKTSNKLPVLVNLVVLATVVYFIVTEGVIDVSNGLIVGVVFSILLGLLLGETLFSIVNMFFLWKSGNDTWDGYLIKTYTFVPVFVVVLMWYISIGYLLYQTVLIIA